MRQKEIAESFTHTRPDPDTAPPKERLNVRACILGKELLDSIKEMLEYLYINNKEYHNHFLQILKDNHVDIL